MRLLCQLGRQLDPADLAGGGDRLGPERHVWSRSFVVPLLALPRRGGRSVRRTGPVAISARLRLWAASGADRSGRRPCRAGFGRSDDHCHCLFPGPALGFSRGRVFPCACTDERDARLSAVCRGTPDVPSSGGGRDGRRIGRAGSRFSMGCSRADPEAGAGFPAHSGRDWSGTATALRNRVYGDDLSLWMDTVAKKPLSALAQANAGKALLDRGRTAEGLACCQKAVNLDPVKPLARYNLGYAYEAGKRWDEALNEFTAAARLNPKLFAAEFRAGPIARSSGPSGGGRTLSPRCSGDRPRFCRDSRQPWRGPRHAGSTDRGDR